MIGKVFTLKNIPAGACIYYDTEKNRLVVFDPKSEKICALAMPFVVEGIEPDPRIEKSPWL